MKPTVNVLYLPGTNCQVETLRAFTEVGAQARLRFASEVASGAARLDDADILCIPGGFSYGDHLGAGLVAGLLLRTKVAEQFAACRQRPIIGICNGFQIALRAGCFGDGVALRTNESGTFCNNPYQRHQIVEDNDSPWLAGLGGSVLEFPRANGEGRFVYRVGRHRSDAPGWRTALYYLDGSDAKTIGGVTSTDGLSFGLMDHPERAMDPEVRRVFFENGVRAAK